MSVLYPDEAAALEAIWHDDFFHQDGLTIIYRESPAYLDQAMPLNLYTDQNHIIELSRCGLVLNRHIDCRDVEGVENTLIAFQAKRNPENLAHQQAVLRANRFLAMGLARFYLRRCRPGKDDREKTAWTQALQWLEQGAK